MDYGLTDILTGYYAENFYNGNGPQTRGSSASFEELTRQAEQNRQYMNGGRDMSFEDICDMRYPGAYCYVPPELEEKLRADPKLAGKVIAELDKILSQRDFFGRHPYGNKRQDSALVILNEDGEVVNYYRQSDQITGPTREELRQIKAEQEAKRRRREHYVKLLKESAIKRKLLEQQSNEKHVKDVLEEKQDKEDEKVHEQELTDAEESKTDSEIVVKPDGSRVLMLTTHVGGAESSVAIEISKPTNMADDTRLSEQDINNIQEAMVNMASAMISR